MYVVHVPRTTYTLHEAGWYKSATILFFIATFLLHHRVLHHHTYFVQGNVPGIVAQFWQT